LSKGGTVLVVPPFVALTGGIGSGKSTALAAFERLGAAVISTDAIVHELYGTDAVRDAMVARFGVEVAPEGIVDRGALAARAFATDVDRDWLEQLLWPLVRGRVSAWHEQMLRTEPPPPVLVAEVPLLFEAGSEDMYDATIAVVADEQVRAARAQTRGHRALVERDARQLSQEEKAARSSFVVVNDGSEQELEQKLSAILAILET
jgi:dephospho-CoA kinase